MTLGGVFSWWWRDTCEKTTVARVMEQECSMYRHHMWQADEDTGAELPIMLYSLIQQLVRQDPACYRIMVTLRPDHE